MNWEVVKIIGCIWALMSMAFCLGWIFGGAQKPRLPPGMPLCPHNDDWDDCPVCRH